MDISEYRKRYAEELEQASAQEETSFAIDTGTRSLAERRLALPGVATNAAATAQAKGIVQDKGDDPQLRAAAVRSLPVEQDQGDDHISALLNMFGDRSEPAVVRLASLKALQQASFLPQVFDPRRPEYLTTLRENVDDPDPALRQNILEVLAKNKDEYAQRRLLEGLQDPSKALISAGKAIQLLGYDTHAEHFPILRDFARQPTDPEAQQEALRLLASDPASQNLFDQLLNDPGQTREVRALSAIGLQAIAPADFEQQARKIVLDDREDADLRATCISALAHFDAYQKTRDDALLMDRVKDLSANSTSPNLKSSAQQLLLKQQP